MNPTVVITNKSLISAGEQIISIQQDGQFKVIGVAKKPADALMIIEELKPDIAVVDMHMPEVGGTALTRAIHAGNPDQIVVMMSHFTDPQHEAHALAAGAIGLAQKESLSADLARIVSQIKTTASSH